MFDGVLFWHTPAKGIRVTGANADVVPGGGVMTSGSIRIDGGRVRLFGLLPRPDPVAFDPGTTVTFGPDVTARTAVEGTFHGRGAAITVRAPADRVSVHGNVTR